MKFPLHHSPFSRRGSYLQLERGFDFDNTRVMLGSARRSIWRSASRGGWGTHFFAIQLTSPTDDADYDVTARPWLCEGRADGEQSWQAAIADEETMVFRGKGSGITFAATRGMGWSEKRPNGVVVIYDLSGDCVHHFRLLGKGRLSLRQSVDPGRPGKSGAADYLFSVIAEPAEGGRCVEVAYRNGLRGEEQPFDEPVDSLEQASARAKADYQRWLSKCPALLDEHAGMGEFAWFMLWNQEMPTGGAFGNRRAIIMSRFWMNSVWAWDACFDAMGVCGADADLAWDQVMLHFDHQRSNGQLPDSINDDKPMFGFVKPPVQGWTIMRLLSDYGVEASIDRLADVYDRLLAWQQWWYENRCDRADGLCRYMHGNDSGWDNGTVFGDGRPVISPDLQALLITQWKALGYIATILGRASEAESHLTKAHRHHQAMHRAMVRDGRYGYIDGDGRLLPSTSTLTRMPVMLGRDLPPETRDRVIKDLSPSSPHVTPFSLATEATNSPLYVDDGYWRGPIWAPEVWMAIDGLRRANATAEATELARRFCELCNQADSAMHENYDARTGQGLRSPAYSWTAAVYLMAARWLAEAKPQATTDPQPVVRRLATTDVPQPAST